MLDTSIPQQHCIKRITAGLDSNQKGGIYIWRIPMPRVLFSIARTLLQITKKKYFIASYKHKPMI